MRRGRMSSTGWLLTGFAGILLIFGTEMALRTFNPKPPPPPEDPLAKVKPPFEVGDSAPDIILPDSKGQIQQLSKVVRKPSLMIFSCGCANCRTFQTYLGMLVKKLGPKAPDIISAGSTDPAAEEAWVRDTGLRQYVMMYEKGAGPEATPKTHYIDDWKGHPCPRAFGLDKKLKVSWIGTSPEQTQGSIYPLQLELAEKLGFVVPGPEKKAAKGRLIAPDPIPDGPGAPSLPQSMGSLPGSTPG